MFGNTLTKLMAQFDKCDAQDKWAEAMAKDMSTYDGLENIQWSVRCYDYSSSSDLATVEVTGVKDGETKVAIFVIAGHAKPEHVAEELSWHFVEDDHGKPRKWADVPDRQKWM